MIRYQLPYNHRQANDEISININPSILILWSITSACASPSSCWQIYSILSKTEAKKTSSDVKTSLVHHIVFAMILSQALIWSHGFLIPWLDPVTKIKWIFWRIELNEFLRIKLNGYKGIKLNKHRNIKLNLRGICTFAVFFSVSRRFCSFTVVYEGHFVLCRKEKIALLVRVMANFERS